MAAVIPAAQSSLARLPTFIEAATWPSAAATVAGCTSTRAAAQRGKPQSTIRRQLLGQQSHPLASGNEPSRLVQLLATPEGSIPNQYREFAAGLRDGTNLVPDVAHAAARHRLADAIQRPPTAEPLNRRADPPVAAQRRRPVPSSTSSHMFPPRAHCTNRERARSLPTEAPGPPASSAPSLRQPISVAARSLAVALRSRRASRSAAPRRS
jgi:hypothetical protein